jgi:hypothetical protein
MSGSIEFLFNPGQTVWVIETVPSCASGSTASAIAIREGSVIRLRATVTITSVPVQGSPLVYDGVQYDVRLGSDAGTSTFGEDDVFGSLTDAVTEYQTRLA